MTDVRDELMDERLEVAGRRWRQAQPPSPAVDVKRLGERSPRGSVVRLLLAATIAVAVAGAAFAVGRASVDSSSTPAPSEQPTRTIGPAVPGAVPWKPITPHDPHLRTRQHGRVTTPYDDVFASGDLDSHAHPGDELTFVVRLESPTRIPLDPCPDYGIAFGVGSANRWGLNCAQDPFRDAQGRPYLPAGKAVPFEMRVVVPDNPGRQKVLWTLNGPMSMPGFYGIVTVTPR